MPKYLIEEYSEMSSSKPKQTKTNKESKKSSKKSSKKPSKKPSMSSKKSSKNPSMSSKKSSKKAPDKSSKKASKKASKKLSKVKLSRTHMDSDLLDSDDEINYDNNSDSDSSSDSNSSDNSDELSISKPLQRTSGLRPNMAKISETNKQIAKTLGMNICPALLSYIKENFRSVAKKDKSESEIKDYETIEKQTLEIFKNYLKNHSTKQILEGIEKKAEEIKKKKADKKANK